MDPPELTNFGSLVRFALELESSSAAFYRASCQLLASGSAADLLAELGDQHEGRHRLLERTRQQKLNEMVLEPITGLDGARYVFDVRVTLSSEVPGTAIRLEDTGARFYGESAVIAKSLLTEAARTFQKLADENTRNLERLRGAFRS